MAVHSHIDGGYTIISMVGKQPYPWQHTTISTIISMAGTQPYPWQVHYYIHGRYNTISMAGRLALFLNMHIVLKVGHSSNDLLKSIFRYLLT